MSTSRPHRMRDFSSFDVLVEKVGAGGFGLVFMGPDRLHNGRWAALKTLRPELLALSPQLRDLFLEECLTWVGFWPHANLLTAQTVTEIDGRLCLVLDYAQSGSLRDLLALNQPFATRLLWAQMIAAGLVALHTPDHEMLRSHPLVHRDLKPENVLVNEQGYAKISDFGLAVRVEQALREASEEGAAGWDLLLQIDPSSITIHTGPSSRAEQDASKEYQGGALQLEPPPLQMEIVHTVAPQNPLESVAFDRAALTQHIHARSLRRTNSTRVATVNGDGQARLPGLGGVGTIAYMPPEQWDADGDVGPPADLYAFGLILSELLAGRHGLADLESVLDEDGWYQLHRSGTPRPLGSGPAEGASRLPQEVEKLYSRLLAKRPEDRPTAEEALKTLQDAAGRLGQRPYSNPDLYPRDRNSRRIRWNNWASAYYRFNRYEQALECNDRAFALAPNDPDVLNTRASILSAQGQALRRSGGEDKGRSLQGEALEMLYQALEETPGTMMLGRKRVHSSLAILLNEMERYGESEDEYAEALALMPDDFYAWRNRTLNLIAWAKDERRDRRSTEARRHLKLALQCIRQARHLGLSLAESELIIANIEQELADMEP